MNPPLFSIIMPVYNAAEDAVRRSRFNHGADLPGLGTAAG